MFDYVDPVAVLKTTDNVCVYTVQDFPTNPGLAWLLDALYVESDEELGVCEVKPEILADPDGEVYDIILNDKSIGFFAVLTFAKAHPRLKVPEVIQRGPREDIDFLKICNDTGWCAVTVPLFGDIE